MLLRLTRAEALSFLNAEVNPRWDPDLLSKLDRSAGRQEISLSE